MNDTIETTTHSEASVKVLIRELVLELAPNTAITEIKDEHKFIDDLNFHSLALMELAFTLEDELGLDAVEEQKLVDIVTIADIDKHVISELTAKGNLAG